MDLFWTKKEKKQNNKKERDGKEIFEGILQDSPSLSKETIFSGGKKWCI